jgi:hypothetical protein
MRIKRGRLHGNDNRMELLQKLARIVAGQITTSPHSSSGYEKRRIVS